MTLDGEDIEIPPSKSDGYYSVTVECDNADGEWDKEKWGAVITNINSNRVKCNVNFETLETLSSIVELGDYISMTPTSTSYTISKSLTGYSSNQTINPSELNLWRVISKNEDGTVEAVSEYVSSIGIYFYGKAGFMNLVGGLNTIAAQYTNEKYVSKTRHIGYSNQIEWCTSISSSSYCPRDEGYATDTNLVRVAIGTIIAKKTNGIASAYWLASRNYLSSIDLAIYRIVTSGAVANNDVCNTNREHASDAVSIRPILTLKSNVQIASGDGKNESTAYQLS